MPVLRASSAERRGTLRPLRLGARRNQTAEGKASDLVAVMFSIVPGLGHIYKGHILAGLLWMIGAIPVGIFVFLAAFASAGWGLGLFFFYLAAAMLHAYGIEDRVVPPKEDEGEEY